MTLNIYNMVIVKWFQDMGPFHGHMHAYWKIALIPHTIRYIGKVECENPACSISNSSVLCIHSCHYFYSIILQMNVPLKWESINSLTSRQHIKWMLLHDTPPSSAYRNLDHPHVHGILVNHHLFSSSVWIWYVHAWYTD